MDHTNEDKEEDIANSNPIIKTTNRHPNKTCEYCGRKNIYWEKQGFPSILECFDCIMVHDGLFDQIRGRKPKKNNDDNNSQQLLFPLTIFDITNNVVVGEYGNKGKIQNAIDRYQLKQKGKVKISVIHYPDYYD